MFLEKIWCRGCHGAVNVHAMCQDEMWRFFLAPPGTAHFGNMVPWLPRRRKTPRVHTAPTNPLGCPNRELHTLGNMVPWLPRRRKPPRVHTAPTNPLGSPNGNCTLLEMWCRGCHGAVKPPEFTLPQQTLWAAPTGTAHFWKYGAVAATAPQNP